ncbi:unnamed protein product, partial [Amoebophrya sp. A120]
FLLAPGVCWAPGPARRACDALFILGRGARGLLGPSRTPVRVSVPLRPLGAAACLLARSGGAPRCWATGGRRCRVPCYREPPVGPS